MPEEETREQIEEIVNNNAEEPIKEEEPVEEEERAVAAHRPKSKAKSKAKAKPKVKIVKEPVEAIQEIEEPVVVVEEPPKNIDKLKQIVKCPDCNLEMTQHTLKYIHKRRGFCKADVKEAPEPEIQKQKITQDSVNDYIKENPETISNYLRNGRALKAQRKQMNARSLLNNAFLNIYLFYYIKFKMPRRAADAHKKKASPGSIQFNNLIAELPEKREKIKHRFSLDMTF